MQDTKKGALRTP